jgi:hypothetical protein
MSRVGFEPMTRMFERAKIEFCLRLQVKHTQLGPIDIVPISGDRIQSPKRCVSKSKQDGVLDKNRTMNNVKKYNICINVPLSQISRG